MQWAVQVDDQEVQDYLVEVHLVVVGQVEVGNKKNIIIRKNKNGE